MVLRSNFVSRKQNVLGTPLNMLSTVAGVLVICSENTLNLLLFSNFENISMNIIKSHLSPCATRASLESATRMRVLVCANTQEHSRNNSQNYVAATVHTNIWLCCAKLVQLFNLTIAWGWRLNAKRLVHALDCKIDHILYNPSDSSGE